MFGHTFGHALVYTRGCLCSGEKVSCSFRLSVLISQEDLERFGVCDAGAKRNQPGCVRVVVAVAVVVVVVAAFLNYATL